MVSNTLRNMRPGSQLLFTGFVVLVSFFIIQLLASLVVIPIYGFSRVSGMLGGLDFADPGTVNMLKYFQVVQSVGLFIVPSVLVARFLYPRWTSYLYLTTKPSLRNAFWVIILVIIINPFINFTGDLNANMHFPSWLSGLEQWMRNAEDAAEKLVKVFLDVKTAWGLLFNLFMIAVLPAVGEELLFRGIIQKLFTKIIRNAHWGIWLSAALFSALHMQFYGFIPRMLLGAMFGYLLVWSGTLWLPILAHFINNAGAVILLYLIGKGKISPGIEEFGAGTDGWHYALVSLAMGAIILMVVRQHYREILPAEEAALSGKPNNETSEPADA